MRREGRVTGYVPSQRNSRAEKEQFEQHLQDLGFSAPFNLLDTHPRVKITNKPTNQSKDSSRCKRKACLGCHAHPASKALSKTKGLRNKLCSSAYRRSCRNIKPHFLIDSNCFDLYDHDPLSDSSNAHSVEDDYAHENEAAFDDDVCSAGAHLADRSNVNDDHSIQKGGIGGEQPSYTHGDDLGCNLPRQLEGLEKCRQSPPEHEGLPAVPKSSPPFDDEGSIDWCQVEGLEVESDDEDWIIC